MTHDNEKYDAPACEALPEALRFELRALRREVPPATELWPSIAQRIAATPQSPARPVTRAPGWRRLAPLATAASLALAIGIAWQLRPVEAPVRATAAANDPHAQLIAREAAAMTLEYQAALKVIDTSAQATTAVPASPELQVLDRSAAQIRTALSHDPDARFLLDRLQRTYTRRLEITQRMATRNTLAS